MRLKARPTSRIFTEDFRNEELRSLPLRMLDNEARYWLLTSEYEYQDTALSARGMNRNERLVWDDDDNPVDELFTNFKNSGFYHENEYAVTNPYGYLVQLEKFKRGEVTTMDPPDGQEAKVYRRREYFRRLQSIMNPKMSKGLASQEC